MYKLGLILIYISYSVSGKKRIRQTFWLGWQDDRKIKIFSHFLQERFINKKVIYSFTNSLRLNHNQALIQSVNNTDELALIYIEGQSICLNF